MSATADHRVIHKAHPENRNFDSAFHSILKLDSVSWGYSGKMIRMAFLTLVLRVSDWFIASIAETDPAADQAGQQEK